MAKKAKKTQKRAKQKQKSAPAKELGRPESEFTNQQIRDIEQMAFDQCYDKTIAKVIGCAVETLKKHFSTKIIQKRAEGKAALHRSQMKQAQTNPTMAIFLGKNYLGQADKQEHIIEEQKPEQKLEIKDIKRRLQDLENAGNGLATD